MSHSWRPAVRAQHWRRTFAGAFLALAFNLCVLVLPFAAAGALLIIDRDGLYTYAYSEAGARAIRARVERLNGELIQLEYDRLRQWDDLVALELMAGDVTAARGFLLSGGGMLPRRMASILNRSENDAEREAAALEFLSPGTRARYEATVPLLSRRAASGAAEPLTPTSDLTLDDRQDFELMARSLLSEPGTDSLQFILAGFSLGLAGEADEELHKGAAALLLASRRPDYPVGLEADVNAVMSAAAPLDAFRAAAMERGSSDPGAYENAAAAFRAAVEPVASERARAMLEEIGAMAAATSTAAAADFLLHAGSARDLARLRLLAQSAGERAASAAKRLPRDGRLLNAAGGALAFNRDLIAALALALAAFLGVLTIAAYKIYQGVRSLWRNPYEDLEADYGAELVDIGAIGGTNFRPL